MSTANNSWLIRTATANDLDNIRLLYRKVWGFNRPEKFDRWRFTKSLEGLCPITLAIDKNKVVGAYSLWPVKLKVGGEVLLGGQSMDTMTHPEYQGQGVFTQLAEACYELASSKGYQLLYGFPNALSYPGFVGKLGWAQAGSVSHWVRFIKPSKYQKVPNSLGNFVDFVAGILPSGGFAEFDVLLKMPSEHELENLIVNWSSILRLCQIERNLEWFRWRYVDQAENDYKWVSVYKYGKLVATAIWGMKNDSWGAACDSRAHLVELLAMNPRATKAALCAVIKSAEKKGAMLLETVCNIDTITRELPWLGFYKHRKAPFIVKFVGNEQLSSNLFFQHNWRIVGGDLDTF